MAATPVPASPCAALFEALLTNEMLPLVEPLACGTNVGLKLVLCPAASVIGNVRPVTENSGLFELAEDIVTLPPLAVSVAELL
jgi:hypothetical protein